MRTVRFIKSIRNIITGCKAKGMTIGFVPTMGYFHEGHLSLMRKARKENRFVIVSIYVNPIQFGPKEDHGRYPRDLKRDLAMARSVGVDMVFVPSDGEMYPLMKKGARARGAGGFNISTIQVPFVSDGLCGVSRPGHFIGVATVVAKLLNIIMPDRVYLGQKDAQQVAVLKKMVYDLNFYVKIIVGKTVREPDGLAMSSRNVYLSPTERAEAAMISHALRKAGAMVARGELDAKKIIFEIKKLLLDNTGASIEYISCVNTSDLSPVRRIEGEALIALAVRFPSARLIDNILVKCK